jgi:hypothetical protein
MTPELPRPDGVGRRAPTTGSSSHLNGNGARTMPDPDLGAGGMYVIAYAFCALSGFMVGVLVGALLF